MNSTVVLVATVIVVFLLFQMLNRSWWTLAPGSPPVRRWIMRRTGEAGMYRTGWSPFGSGGYRSSGLAILLVSSAASDAGVWRTRHGWTAALESASELAVEGLDTDLKKPMSPPQDHRICW